MKIKKTIAAIAAATMVFSSLPMAAFADDGDTDNSAPIVTDDNGETSDVTETGADNEDEQNPTEPAGEDNINDVMPLDETELEQELAVQAVTDVEVSGYTGSTITAAMGTVGNTTHVSVKIPTGVTGSTEPNVDNEGEPSNIPGRGVYCIRIPVTGLTSEWDFGSGSHYAADAGNKANNIKNGELLLWLDTTVRATYTINLINLTNGSETKTIYITQEGETTVPTLGATVDGNPVDADKVTTTTESGAIVVSVTLPEGAEGKPEDGSGNKHPSNNDYYLVIPVPGIDPSWTFKSGWDYDQKSHHEWNISTGALKLWVPVGNNTTHTIVLTNGSATKTIVIKTNPEAEVVSTVTVGTVDNSSVDSTTVKNGTAAVTKADVNGTPTITVTLTPSGDEAIGGMPEGGVAGARENYYITIPVTGLTTDWTFNGGYDFDSAVHTDNIDTDVLKLWLPVTNKEHTIVLKKDTETLTIKVKTIVNAPVVPQEHTHNFNGACEPWDEDTHTTACPDCPSNAFYLSHHSYGADGYTHTLTCLDCGYGTGAAEAHVDSDKNGECDVCGSTDLRNLAVPVNPAPAPSTGGSSGFVAPPATITTTTITSNTVSTPAQVRTSSKSNITINAAETKVTPAIINAFTKNKKAKTLTVSYGSKMKIVIKKSDVKDVSSTLDFSVTGKNFLSSKIKNSSALAKAKKIVQIDFVKEGKFDGVDKVTVQSRVGAKYVGRKATVYEYVNGKLVKVAKATVGGSGLVSFNIDHYGQYVVVVN